MIITMVRCSILVVLLCIAMTRACPYHRMLERLQQQQREREREFKRRFGLLTESRSPSVYETPSPPSQPIVSNIPHINLTPERQTSTDSRQEYFVSSNPELQQSPYASNLPKGYILCPNSNFYCPPDTQCVPERGTYVCRRWNPPSGGSGSCGSGLKRIDISQYQYKCVDIDECADNSTNECEQRCRNYFRGYQCLCDFGYLMSAEEKCEDVDECSNQQHRCQHECLNTEGSYTCQCPIGYQQRNTYYCSDINECDEGEVCSDGEECLNLFGDYECNSPSPCDAGYHRTNSTTSSKPGPCVVDTYDPNIPVSISENRFALQRNYPAYQEVGRLRYTNRPGHQYFFNVVEGRDHFQVLQTAYYLSIRTKRILDTPGPLTMKVEITDSSYDRYYRRLITKSRVDITFVISQYSF